MKERPILFSSPMVRAILDGRKSVTRRLVRERAGYRIDVARDGVPVYVTGAPDDGGEPIPCPYGEPGDRLWVKETWRPSIADGGGLVPDSADVVVRYEADGAERYFDETSIPDEWTRPTAARRGNVSPLFMPRWASRITLEIVDVRCERLHDITEEDAFNEGLDMNAAGTFYVEAGEDELAEFAEPRTAFAFLWDGINGKRASWEANPWVWRVEFRRLTQ